LREKNRAAGIQVVLLFVLLVVLLFVLRGDAFSTVVSQTVLYARDLTERAKGSTD
jgi:hypothetical protein